MLTIIVMYALSELCAHGLHHGALHLVARGTTVAKLLYVAPAWWGFSMADERLRIERFVFRMKRLDYLSEDTRGGAQMVETAEDGLLRSIMYHEFHVLRSICPLQLNENMIYGHNHMSSHYHFEMIITSSDRSCTDGTEYSPCRIC